MFQIDEDNRPFADAFRRGRKMLKLDRIDLADAIGVDVRSIERWEYGECLPQPYYIDKLVHFMPEIMGIYNSVKKKVAYINAVKPIY